MIARNVTAREGDAARVAAELVDGLVDPSLRLAVVFANWQIDAVTLARELQQRLGTTPVIGCSTLGVIGATRDATAVAMGLYGDGVRVGIGVASELPDRALVRSRDAVHEAARALGTTAEALDPVRHVAFTLVDGTCRNEDAFCMGSATAAAQIRFIGGAASTENASGRRGFVWANGEARIDAGIVVVLELAQRFEAVTSAHLVSTEVKTVVTKASDHSIYELDGMPATRRLHELVAQLGVRLDDSRPSQYAFARFVNGIPYMRTMTRLDGQGIRMASAVETGHILHIVRPGDLIGQTKLDLDAAAARLGGMSALIACSCVGRHWEAAATKLDTQLAELYASYPTTGFQSFGEQSGLVLVNHSLTALAIGGE